jgi:hypothetical protein
MIDPYFLRRDKASVFGTVDDIDKQTSQTVDDDVDGTDQSPLNETSAALKFECTRCS